MGGTARAKPSKTLKRTESAACHFRINMCHTLNSSLHVRNVVIELNIDSHHPAYKTASYSVRGIFSSLCKMTTPALISKSHSSPFPCEQTQDPSSRISPRFPMT
eukprot:693291-Hanusia_phi.AAC.1